MGLVPGLLKSIKHPRGKVLFIDPVHGETAPRLNSTVSDHIVDKGKFELFRNQFVSPLVSVSI